MKEFHIMYDKSAITNTIIAIAIVGVLFVVFNFYLSKKVDFRLIIADAIMILPLLIAFLFAPKSYIVDKTDITIKKYYGNIVIPINDIKSISELKTNDLSGIHRKFASGGFFGYFGKYNSKKLNDFYIYSGSLTSNLVMIEKTDGTKYLITPKDIEQFFKTVNQKR